MALLNKSKMIVTLLFVFLGAWQSNCSKTFPLASPATCQSGSRLMVLSPPFVAPPPGSKSSLSPARVLQQRPPDCPLPPPQGVAGA